jgi:hypothetical protein
MAKNLSLRMRQVAGLDRTGGHLPPPDRRDSGRAISAEPREAVAQGAAARADRTHAKGLVAAALLTPHEGAGVFNGLR